MTIIRFKIGDAFPAEDPVARFITGRAMISNDWLRSIEDMLKLEDDTPEEMGRRMSLFRSQAALVHEAATFITDARRMPVTVHHDVIAQDRFAQLKGAAFWHLRVKLMAFVGGFLLDPSELGDTHERQS